MSDYIKAIVWLAVPIGSGWFVAETIHPFYGAIVFVLLMFVVPGIWGILKAMHDEGKVS